MDPPSVFEEYREEVDAELRAAFDGYSSPLYDVLRYHLGWLTAEGRAGNGTAGEGLRSTLCLLACEALGGDRWAALPDGYIGVCIAPGGRLALPSMIVIPLARDGCVDCEVDEEEAIRMICLGCQACSIPESFRAG